MTWKIIKSLMSKEKISSRNRPQQELKWDDAVKIEAKIKEMIVEELDVDISRVKSGSEFYGDLGASLDFVELIMRCEEEFGIKIPDEDAEQYATVGDLTSYIQKLLLNP
jgi:acyl carrier protein